MTKRIAEFFEYGLLYMCTFGLDGKVVTLGATETADGCWHQVAEDDLTVLNYLGSEGWWAVRPQWFEQVPPKWILDVIAGHNRYAEAKKYRVWEMSRRWLPGTTDSAAVDLDRS